MSALQRFYAKLKAWITDNLPLKILSLALSIALFSIVHSDQDAQRSVFVDVVALLPPEESDQMLLTEIPHEVKVTLRGSQARINALDRNDIRPIQMDLTDPTLRFYYFDPASLDIGGNVQVVEISPATLSLQWARRAQKKVPVKARFDGELADNLTLGEVVTVTPDSVMVRGPVDSIASFDEAQTDFISLTGLGVGTHEVRAPLAILPQHVSYDGEASVLVDLEVREKRIERTLRRLSVAVLGAESAQARPSTVTVTLRGPARRLTDLSPEDVVPYVEVPSDAPPGAISLEVGVRGDLTELEVVTVAPPTVLVRRSPVPRARPRATPSTATPQ